MTNKKFEGNDFAIQVIAKGAFVDNGTYVDSSYLAEATTIRLNHIALNAWILSECFNTRDCYEDGEKGDAEWEAHKAEYEERRKAWKLYFVDEDECRLEAAVRQVADTTLQNVRHDIPSVWRCESVFE